MVFQEGHYILILRIQHSNIRIINIDIICSIILSTSMPRRTSKASGGDDLDSIVHGEQENVPRKVQQK